MNIITFLQDKQKHLKESHPSTSPIRTNKTNKSLYERRRYKEHSIASSSIFPPTWRHSLFTSPIASRHFCSLKFHTTMKILSHVTVSYRSKPDVCNSHRVIVINSLIHKIFLYFKFK